MKRFLWSGAVLAVGMLSACASGGAANTETTTRAQSQQQQQAAQTGNYTDEQLRAYVAAKNEIEPITARYAQMSAQERSQATAQIRTIQQRNGLTAVSYDAIQRRARTDTILAGRIAALELASLSDAQVRAYVAAKNEIEPITARYAQMSAQERSQATAQIRAIQQRNGLTAVSYDAIQRRARTDTTLAGRIAALELASLSDAQVRAFAEASLEIDPISRELAAATTDAQRTAATDRIRGVLEAHHLDGATYNAIATRAQSDEQLAARIAAAQVAARGAEAASGEGSAE